jgi:hypothetical protein
LVNIKVATTLNVANIISDYLCINELVIPSTTSLKAELSDEKEEEENKVEEQSVSAVANILFDDYGSKCCIIVVVKYDDNTSVTLKYEDVYVEDKEEFIEDLLGEHKFLKPTIFQD